jgi:limonene-1,2-epoxide hydrolase
MELCSLKAQLFKFLKENIVKVKEENIEAVEKYLNALKQKDLTLAPLAEDLYFEDPLAGKNTGAENFRAFLSGFLPAIDDVRIHRHISDGEYVATHWEVDGEFGVVPVMEMFRVQNGEITEAIGYFDPRPIIGG